MLKPHQKRALEFAIANRYSICSIDMGGGKTLVGLELSNHFKAPTLVICPAYLIDNWISEIRKWYKDTKIISAFRSKSEIYFPWDSDIAIISYENCKAAEILFTWAKIVILDEGQYLKNMTSIRSESCHRFIYENNIKRLLILTGTPIKNRVPEFYSLIALCEYDPRRGESKFLQQFPEAISFADHFSHRREYEMTVNNRRIKVLNWEGYKNLPQLKQILSNKYFRVKSEEFLDVKEQELFIQISNHTVEGLIEEFESSEMNPDSVRGKAKRMSALAKVSDTIKYVKDLWNTVDRIVIYTDFVESCEAIAKAFEVSPITGKVQMSDRKKIADEFWANDRGILVATIASFSVGVNLQCASDMVFNDVCWSAGDLEQARYRIKRIGQENICRYHYMIGSPQDRYILETLEEKRKTIKDVT